MQFSRNEFAVFIGIVGIVNAGWYMLYPHPVVVMVDMATLILMRWAAYRYAEDEDNDYR